MPLLDRVAPDVVRAIGSCSVFLSAEVLDHSAFDTTGDGKPDQWQYLDPSQKLIKVEYDTNKDGKADRWEHFNASGKVSKVELDRNFDGQVDMTQKKENSHFLFFGY